MNEEYKQLMLFNIITAGDIFPRDYAPSYATVDKDGLLCVFSAKPYIPSTNRQKDNNGMWSNNNGRYTDICIMSEPENWTETLVKL